LLNSEDHVVRELTVGRYTAPGAFRPPGLATARLAPLKIKLPRPAKRPGHKKKKG
jgi:hypothetical protein